MTIPKKEDNPKGLHAKYYIQKIVGTKPHNDFFGNTYYEPILEDVSDNTEYFVLRLDEHQKDIQHFNACRKAINVYADAIAEYLPELSKDLKERYPNYQY